MEVWKGFKGTLCLRYVVPNYFVQIEYEKNENVHDIEPYFHKKINNIKNYPPFGVRGILMKTTKNLLIYASALLVLFSCGKKVASEGIAAETV